ncbi:phosphotransferase [Aestuariibacter halophilus]|uniref:Phosphotransferase n=1 Tax=Fluctibacter halophilus TaxID=226011 RepID=A0ABS8G830_9ALTE|nr:phosphotransferase [Aestuariibacter halophilus]MCC2616688.1 phosphotransferase [Aestuariibacter halophilus]
MSSNLYDALRSTHLFGEHFTLTPVDGGVINHSFKLQTTEHAFFVKRFQTNRLTSVDRQAQYSLQHQLAQHGAAPEPVFLSQRHDVQVEHWVPHSTLAQANRSQEDNILALAQRLAWIHQLPVFALSLDLMADWEAYLARVEHLNGDWRQQMAKLAPVWYDSHGVDQVLCHHDLQFEHVCADISCVFDWEYAATGNRYFDVASCVAINQLTVPQTRTLLNAYADASGIHGDDVARGYQQQAPLVTLTNQLWFAAADSLRESD